MKKIIFILMISFLPFTAAAKTDTAIEVTADSALEWDRANNKFTASGDALISQGDSSISAPTIIAEYNDGETITIRHITAHSNAVLKQPDQTLSAISVQADFNDGVLGTVTAEGNVILKTKTETLYGDKAIYESQKRLITVTGDVRIEQDKNVLTGNKATFDMTTNISTMTASEESGGRVKAIFYGESGQ